ncbi:MAG: NAD-dependent epimerase/dehydratase family protein [Candidatus Firestonebacteria bacterium]
MKILVTGGAGFIASHIVDLYVEKGHQVVVVDNFSTGKKENLNQKAKLYTIDIYKDTDELKKIFKKENFDVVNHHAAQISVSYSAKDPIFDAKVNVLGSLNLLQNCIKYKMKKIIFASSGGTVYGRTEKLPVSENLPLSPFSPYGITKAAVDFYLDFYNKEYGLKYVSLRYGNVYGPRQDPHGEAGVVAIFSKKMLADEIPIINGDGKYIRDYVFCKDIACANLLALEKDVIGAYNVGTTIGTDVNQLFKLLSEIIGFKHPAKYGPPRAGDLRKSVLSYKKIYMGLNWKPSVSLKQGFKETVEFFKK